MNELLNILRSSTVKIGDSDSLFGTGTGFFVSPATILTCFHVINDMVGPINIYYNGNRFEAKIIDKNEELDLAVLRCEASNHSCVFIKNELEVDDRLIVIGFSEDNPLGDMVSLTFEGYSKYEQFPEDLLKLKEGVVQKGLSGAPILNARTSAICGMIKETRNNTHPYGGYGITVNSLFTSFPYIKDDNNLFHLSNHDWSESLPAKKRGLTAWDSTNKKTHYHLFGNINMPKIDELIIEPNYQLIELVAEKKEIRTTKTFNADCISILDEQYILVITGPYGAGKTICTKNLQAELKENNRYEIIFIEASTLVNQSSFDEFMKLVEERSETISKLLIIFDGFDEINKLKKEDAPKFSSYLTKIVHFAVRLHIKFIINVRDLIKNEEPIIDYLYSDYLVNHNIERFKYIFIDHFSNTHIDKWLDSYFNYTATKTGKEKRFSSSNLHSLNKSFKNSCQNPILLFLLADTFFNKHKSVEQINLFDLYRHFVDFTIKGKFSLSNKGTGSQSIKEIQGFYRDFLKNISISIVANDVRSVINATESIKTNEFEDIVLDPNVKKYSISSKNIEEHVLNLAKQIISSHVLDQFDLVRLKENIFVCYFLEKRDDRWSFKDNNLLFYFIAEILFEALEKAISIQQTNYDQLEDTDTHKIFECFEQLKGIHVHPLSLDIVMNKIDELNKTQKNCLIDILLDSINQGRLLNLEKNKLNDLNIDTIGLEIWLSLVFIHLNKSSYDDKHLFYFFKRLSWFVSAGKIVNRNLSFLARRFLRRASIKGVEIRRINCDGYNFDFSSFESIKFIQVKFHDARMNYITSHDSEFYLCDFDSVSMDEFGGNAIFQNCVINKLSIRSPKKCSFKFKRCYIKWLEIDSNKHKNDITIEIDSCDIDHFSFKNAISRSFHIKNSSFSPIKVEHSEVHYHIIDCRPKGKTPFSETQHAKLDPLDF